MFVCLSTLTPMFVKFKLFMEAWHGMIEDFLHSLKYNDLGPYKNFTKRHCKFWEE